MLFFPYRADLELHHVPLVTMLICVVCLSVYFVQYRNEARVINATEAFCAQQSPVMFRLVMQRTMQDTSPRACAEMMFGVHLAEDKRAHIENLVASGAPLEGLSAEDSNTYAADVVEKEYRRYRIHTPDYDTRQLWYEPRSWSLQSMITAAFAHASWWHVVGNLFFFFAFAATVEVILGWWRFVLLTAGIAIGSHAFYSIAMLNLADPLPTVGLSGVVMGMMALFTFFLPRGNIRCLLWIIVLIRTIAVPAWLLAAWYIGWDVYALFHDAEQSGINVVAHVSGAALGYLAGVAFFRKRRAEVRLAT